MDYYALLMSDISCPTSSFNSLFPVLNLEICSPKRYSIRVTRYVARLWHGEYYDFVSACHLYGKSGNSGENSNGTVHLVKLFQKKVNTFRGGTYFPLVPKRPEFVGETNFDIWTYPTTRSHAFAPLTVSCADGTVDK